MTATLFAQLCDHYRAAPDRKGEVWVDCPFCGKPKDHFSFRDSERGGTYKCFSCAAHGPLRKLADTLRLDTSRPVAYVPPARKPATAVPWQADGAGLIADYCQHPERIARWQAYKPLSLASLNRHRFGYGRLPFQGKSGWYWSQDDWLIVPLFHERKLVGLRGRAPAGERRANRDGKELRWISATGTRYVLWNIENIRPGGTLWICENHVDAAWLMETHPDYDAVALGGASNWRDEWAEAVAAAGPRLVMVGLDNDLAGQAQGRMYSRLLAERRREHPGLPDLTPNGPKIANSLQRLGVQARLFRWPADAPAKADVGWLLARQPQKEAA